MEYRFLGRTWLKVSPLCLGTANFADPTPEEECISIVNGAIEGGINLIDTADSRAALRGGIYAERVTQKGIEVGDRFVQLAKEAGISPAQLSILWAKDQDGITAPLIGPRSVKQVEELLPVLEMRLDAEVREACDGLVPPGSAAADFFNSAEWMKMKIL